MWAFRLDPSLTPRGYDMVRARRQPEARSSFISQVTNKPMNTPSFEERAEQMHEAAFKLKEIAEFILLEAQRMQAANAKFLARKAPQTRTATR